MSDAPIRWRTLVSILKMAEANITTARAGTEFSGIFSALFQTREVSPSPRPPGSGQSQKIACSVCAAMPGGMTWHRHPAGGDRGRPARVVPDGRAGCPANPTAGTAVPRITRADTPFQPSDQCAAPSFPHGCRSKARCPLRHHGGDFQDSPLRAFSKPTSAAVQCSQRLTSPP